MYVPYKKSLIKPVADKLPSPPLVSSSPLWNENKVFLQTLFIVIFLFFSAHAYSDLNFFYDKTGALKKSALTIQGQLTYATLYQNGNMLKALSEAQTLLRANMSPSAIENKLQWKPYPGSVNEFLKIRNLLYVKNLFYSKNKYLNPDYEEFSGQIRFALELGLNLHTAFEKARMTAPNQFIRPDGWVSGYTGPIYGLRQMIHRLKNDAYTSSTNKKSKYLSLEGQARLGQAINVPNLLTLYNYITLLKNFEGFSKEVSYELRRLAHKLAQTWSPFDGSLQELKQETTYFLDPEGRIRPEIITTTGQAQIARRYYNGNMEKAFERGEAIFATYNVPFFPLLWIKVKMTSDIFFKKQARLYSADGSLKNIYKYHAGQARYAKDWHTGDMYDGYEEIVLLLKIPEISRPPLHAPVSYIPSSLEFFTGIDTRKVVEHYIQLAIKRHLGWTQYLITKTSKNFQNKREMFVASNGKPKKQWQGVAGQIKYAKKKTEGSMSKAKEVEQYVFGNEPGLKWKDIFWTSAEEVEEIIQRFLDPNGQVKAQYLAEKGYFLYAKQYTKRDLDKAFTHFTYLPEELQKKLKWQQYKGSIEDFNRDSALFLQYPGREGLLKFAKEFYKGSIIRAYLNILAIFKGDHKALYKKTKWLPYFNHLVNLRINNQIPFYERDQKLLILKNGAVNPIYKGMKGYIRFSEQYYKGDMFTAYYNARAVLGQWSLADSMDWHLFPGTTAEFKSMADFMSHPDTLKDGIEAKIALEQKGLISLQEVKRVARVFMAKNDIVSYYAERVKMQIQAFIEFNNSSLCKEAF